jgi:hypothetical protein
MAEGGRQKAAVPQPGGWEVKIASSRWSGIRNDGARKMDMGNKAVGGG